VHTAKLQLDVLARRGATTRFRNVPGEPGANAMFGPGCLSRAVRDRDVAAGASMDGFTASRERQPRPRIWRSGGHAAATSYTARPKARRRCRRPERRPPRATHRAPQNRTWPGRRDATLPTLRICRENRLGGGPANSRSQSASIFFTADAAAGCPVIRTGGRE